MTASTALADPPALDPTEPPPAAGPPERRPAVSSPPAPDRAKRRAAASASPGSGTDPSAQAGDEPRLTDATLIEVVGRIPRGRWMGYGDVTALAGGIPRQAMGINQRLTRLTCPGAHRVLKATGEIPPNALGDAASVRVLLASEGIAFNPRGRADQSFRLPRSELA